MKKKKLVLCLLVIVAVFVASGITYQRLGNVYAREAAKQDSADSSDSAPKLEDTHTQNQASEITVYDENGKEVKLSDFFGRPLVVNFWASWCPPCKREMSVFQNAINQYGDNVTFLMINATDSERETKEAAQQFLSTNDYHMNVLYDLDGSAEQTYQLLYLPRTLVIDENGTIVQDHVGELSETELQQMIEKIYSGKKRSEVLDDYKNMSITYLFGNKTEVLDSATIQSWLKVNGSEVNVDEEKVQEYVSELAAKYDTANKKRIFQTTGRETVTFNRSEYGYQIDQEKEKEQIIADIKSKSAVKREPVYSVVGIGRNGLDDLNGSYVEVSLEKQHLWLYKNGELITETDIISGLPTEDRATYTGVWAIAYKASPYTLSSKEYGYSTEVKYWMPFVCGQGLHDADWQTKFGGDVYKTKGSHGCINLPSDQAAIIYQTVEKQYPVICY